MQFFLEQLNLTSHHKWNNNPLKKYKIGASDQKVAYDKMFLELNFSEGLYYTKIMYLKLIDANIPITDINL